MADRCLQTNRAPHVRQIHKVDIKSELLVRRPPSNCKSLPAPTVVTAEMIENLDGALEQLRKRR